MNPAPNRTVRFFYTNGSDGTVYGPVEGPILSSLHAKGVISDDSCILEEGKTDWKQYVERKAPSLAATPPQFTKRDREAKEQPNFTGFKPVTVIKMKFDSPEKINSLIRHAWIAAVVSASATLLVVLLSVAGVQLVPGFGIQNLLDVIILYGLAYGVFRRSRVCAIILFSYGISNEIYMRGFVNNQSPLRLIFLYFYLRGMLASLAYHKSLVFSQEQPLQSFVPIQHPQIPQAIPLPPRPVTLHPPFQFSCPGCGLLMSATHNQINTEAACPTCSQQFLIPAPVSSGPKGTQPITL